MASYYRNYYDHQTEYDDEQSVADSQTDLYGYNNNKFRPQRQNGPSVFDRPSRQARTNNRGPLNHRRSSFMSQDFYYLPENEQGNGFNYTYQQPRHSRPHSSYMSIDPIASPDEYQHYYQDQQQQHGRRQGSQGNKQYQDYPITPEDERNNFLYHDQSLASSSEEVANYSTTLMNNTNNGLYMVPESQHSGVTLDEDDNSFIEDTTTQRNTLINSESCAPVPDAYYQNQPLGPQVGDQVSPLQLTSPFEPPLTQQLQQSEDIVDQNNPAVVVVNSPVEKKKWFKSIVSTALIIKKKAQKLKRDDVSKSNLLRQQQQQQQQQQLAMYGNTASPLIQVISAGNNELVGDVLDSRQQQELITQLYQSPPPAPGSNANLLPEKTKITSLDRIWVFRLIEEDTNTTPNHSSIAWIGFDFDNQLKIEQHIKELETRPEDGRLALYDSHIRHKSMPVIVTPNDNKGYYFADIHQNKLITLEITFIENDHQKVTFVYRV